MPLTWNTREELATRIATVSVIVALSWFAAVKERNRSRSAGRESYVLGLRTDLSCLPLPENAGALNILNQVETTVLQNEDFSPGRDGRCDSHGSPSGAGNRRWSDRHVTFATLDAGRVCAKGGDIAPDLDSCTAHEETVVEWMRETFAEAEFQGTAAIMFIFLDGLSENHTELWLSLREELARFGKPVVDIHRTSPSQRSDEPVHTSRFGAFANLTSVVSGEGEVSGGESVPWMKIYVNTGAAEVFSFVPQTAEQASPSLR